MKATRSTRVVCALIAALVSMSSWRSANGQAAAPCDTISKDVTAAIHKDPSKLLMVVEDALVINESCACEIIQAAIIASHADPATVNQIVQTGISVAPRMSGVITDCAAAVSPGTSIGGPVTSSAKNPDKNPLPPVVPAVIEESYSVPVRGIYLIQPPANGFIRCDGKFRKCDHIPVSPCVCVPKP